MSAEKAIILFSDGTGNSSAKLFKTNVWRMYEAVDLGPPAEGKRQQISYYDDGVGTSAFKPLAVLGGAFGWGLRRNVLDIYRFACRNYREGDQIYGFGFSRGAFTMRLAIALIASQGLVQSDDEAELRQRSSEAYRAFRRDFVPRKLQWPTRAYRYVRDWFYRRFVQRGKPYDHSQNLKPRIRFVGVWDTVAAYGGPIVEITRAIDNWVFALSMPDYRLHESVECARHALALDDERDAFQPLLWDEVHEQQLRDRQLVSPDRLLQVWFTGMHSDVGGGYPDESLSYVSLLWMMEEAEKRADLRTLKTIKERFVALASSAGPIHNSRKGLGAYYRYQPRKIAAWTDPIDETTYGLRDPLLRGDDGVAHGLLRRVHIHESVIARIAAGTDRYAPITLPSDFEIVPPQVEGENAPQPDSEGDTATPEASTKPHPMVSPALHARLSDEAVRTARSTALEAVWDLVWYRRVAYFVTLGLTLLLASMSLWADRAPKPPLLADGRTWIGEVIRLLGLVLPSFTEPLVNTYADNAFYFLALAVLIAGVMRYSSSCELRLRDRARKIWRKATTIDDQPPETPPITGLQKFRNSPDYQRAVQTLKWKVLPDFVVTPLIVMVGLWLLTGAATQATLPLLESGRKLCEPTERELPELTATRLGFSTRNLCHSVGARVVNGERYVVTFEVADQWRDSKYATSPLGLGAGDMNMGIGYLAVPFRRVINARYLQPAIEIRDHSKRVQFNAVHIYPLELEQFGDDRVVYRGEFEAERDGELLLFPNDAVVPLLGDLRYFYERSGSAGNYGNSGTACVTVQRIDLMAEAVPAGSSPACLDAEERAANVARTRGSSGGTR